MTTPNPDEINLCKNCGTMKHLNRDGQCGRCVKVADSRPLIPPNSGELETDAEINELLDEILNTFGAVVVLSMQDEEGYPPHYGYGDEFDATKAEAKQSILHLKQQWQTEARIEIKEWIERNHLGNGLDGDDRWEHCAAEIIQYIDTLATLEKQR